MNEWMNREKDAIENVGLAVLRVGAGALMLTHGWGKLFNFNEKVQDFVQGGMDPLGLGGNITVALLVFAEFFCAIAIIAGLWTRLASIPLMIAMAVAFFVVHADDSFLVKEKALFYLIAFAAVFLLGAGKYSVDGIMKGGGAPSHDAPAEE